MDAAAVVADLIMMEALMYALLLTMPIGKEWLKMKTVRYLAWISRAVRKT